MPIIGKMTDVDVPEDLKEQLMIMGGLLQGLPRDVRTCLLTDLVNAASNKTTDDLEIGINVISRALGYYDAGEERMDVLKQTLEMIMQCVAEEGKNET